MGLEIPNNCLHNRDSFRDVFSTWNETWATKMVGFVFWFVLVFFSCFHTRQVVSRLKVAALGALGDLLVLF